MKNDFDPVPLRDKLLAWTRSAAERQRIRSALQKADLGQPAGEPAQLPEGMSKSSATERFDWALSQLAEERGHLTNLQHELSRGAALRSRLQEFRTQKLAEQRARSRKRKWRLAVATALIVFIAVLAGMVWQAHRPPSITRGVIEKSVADRLENMGFSVSSVSYHTGFALGGTAEIEATFKAKLDQPLYTTVPTEQYLRTRTKLDPELTRQIAALTSGPSGRRILELAGLTNGPVEPWRATLVKVSTPTGGTFDGTAKLEAYRSDGRWEVRCRSARVPGIVGPQWARAGFIGLVFDVGSEAGRAKLQALINEQPAILARLERAQKAYTAEIAAAHRQQEDSLIAYFRPGTIFTGVLSGRGPADRKKLYLEITDSAGGSGTHPLKALLHNDGGWGDGRAFEGEWKYMADNKRFVLSLASRSDQAIRYAGPVLADTRLIEAHLAIDSNGLSGVIDGDAGQWARVPDGETDRVKHDASPDYFAMLEAITPGSYYLGQVKFSAQNTQQVLLHFTRLENRGKVVEAVIQDPDHDAWRCTLSGSLIGNHYREARWPLRLNRIQASLPPGIPRQTFMLQFRTVLLRIEDNTLVSDYGQRLFSFKRLSAEETARRIRNTAAWQQAFNALLRPGATLQGTAEYSRGGSRQPLRVRVTEVNTDNNSITARLEPGGFSFLYRELTGKVFPEAGTLSLTFDVRPRHYNVDRKASEPFFRGGWDSLILSVNNMTLTGRDRDGWDFEFPL